MGLHIVVEDPVRTGRHATIEQRSEGKTQLNCPKATCNVPVMVFGPLGRERCRKGLGDRHHILVQMHNLRNMPSHLVRYPHEVTISDGIYAQVPWEAARQKDSNDFAPGACGFVALSAAPRICNEFRLGRLKPSFSISLCASYLGKAVQWHHNQVSWAISSSGAPYELIDCKRSFA